jgi:hypothetical protein
MKLKYLYFFIIPVITAILLFAAFSTGNTQEEKSGNEKILKFSHSLHAELADCQTCHSKAPESTSVKDRLMPDHESCNDCHDTEDEAQCTTCHFEDTYEPLLQRQSDMIFNHSFHINQQKMACETCHTGLSKVDYGYKAEKPYPMMADCYSCHNDKAIAPNTCESCHISTADLRPQDHRSADFLKEHKFAANNFDADCMMCHDSNNNSCVECHTANNIITEANTPDDFYQPYAPNNFVDGAKMQKLNRVHDLNYRYVHGVDARSKRFDCQSCHQIETFCGECHQSEESDFNMSGTTPASHLKPGFFTYGVGSGGGEHAILARRDIESCVACHDVQGADPTCVTCHMDADGIKGTNSKTHPSGFMSDEEGDWHTSQGSICYNCHVSASPLSQSGTGFCGYCHGAQ